MFRESAGKKLFFILCLAAIYAFGCYLRLIPFPNFSARDGSMYLLEGDNYERLRKVEIILNDYPNLPPHDYFMGFPKGTGNITTPLFDLTLATIVNPLRSFVDSLDPVIYLLAVLPPLIGMLAIIPLFLWVRKVFDARTAVISAFLFAALPASIFTSIAGRPDNELLEPILVSVLFYLYSINIEKINEGNKKSIIIYSVLTGAFLFICLAYWRGAVLWWGMIGAYAFFSALAGIMRSQESRNKTLSGAIIFASAGALASIYTLMEPWGLDAGIHYNRASFFHSILAFIAMSSFLSLALYGYVYEGKKGKALPLATAIAFFLLSLIISFAIAPGFFKNILQGSAIVGGGNEWTGGIAQYQSLFADNEGRFSLIYPLKLSSAYIFLAPLMLIWLTLKIRHANPGYPFFVFSGWSLFALAAINGRYENAFALIAAACGAIFISGIYNSLRSKFNAIAGAVAGAAVLLALLYPAKPFYKGIEHYRPIVITGDLEAALLWMRFFTPEAGDPMQPQKMPDYGVMARWEFGGWIEYVAKRPSIATLYGIETHGLKESAEFFLSTDADEFLGILDENRARYFILSKMLGELEEYALLLGRAPSDYISITRSADGGKTTSTGKRFFELLATSLYYFDGQKVESLAEVQGVSGVRLVYESPSSSDMKGAVEGLRQYKIFERVKGAIITGTARPGERVLLQGTVLTNQRRAFSVSKETFADSRGRFSITADYPTVSEDDQKTGVLGPYTLTIGNARKGLAVTEKDVVEGNTMRLM